MELSGNSFSDFGVCKNCSQKTYFNLLKNASGNKICKRKGAKIVPKISSLSFKYLLQASEGFSLQEAASNPRCKFGLKKEMETVSLPSKTTAFAAEWNLYAAKNFKIQISPAPVIHMPVIQSSNNSSSFETRAEKLPKRARNGIKKDGAFGYAISPLPLSHFTYLPCGARCHREHAAEVALSRRGSQIRRDRSRGGAVSALPPSLSPPKNEPHLRPPPDERNSLRKEVG